MWHVFPGAGAQRHPSRKSYILRPGLRWRQRAQPVAAPVSARQRPKLAPLVRRSSTRISPYARDVVDVREASGGPLKAVVGLPVPASPPRAHTTCFLADAPVLRPELFER